MDAQTANQLTVKMFMGCLITTELRLYITQSTEWKQDAIIQIDGAELLKEIHYQGKDYIGLFLHSEMVTLAELKQVETQIKSKLKHYFPKYRLDIVKLSILPQVFIT